MFLHTITGACTPVCLLAAIDSVETVTPPFGANVGTDALVRPAKQRSAFNDLCKRLSKNHFHSSSSQMEVNRLTIR